MKVAIIGGTGKMGRWFAKFFLDEGMQVIVSGRSKKKLLRIRDELGVEIADNVKAVKGADRVLISVPIENFEEVVKEIHLHVGSDQVVMDICSVKEFPVRVMHEYIKNGTTLGTHPMFGPRADKIQNQNFILTPTDSKERKFADDFKSWLEEKQVNVSIMSPKKHDELMSAVLGLPHFIGIVVYDTLLNCVDLVETKRVAGTSYKLLLTLAETVASQNPEFCASLQTNLPKIESVEGLFCEKAREWLDAVRQKDRAALADKMRFVEAKLEKIGMRRSA
ncbi:MAG: prephenate dehydrogenase/arogenate dehydrogenase family protein [Candidatus Bathyarchaeota archaeon]|nr:MAG: prephenate dehydrogenase/arogenate dehydrogenase family protein [Candidatus Bathyarchaeota archaeon]